MKISGFLWHLIRCSWFSNLRLCVLVFCLMGMADAQQQKDVFRVGAIVPLTGPLADYGEAVRRGFEFARHDYPERFSKVEFVYQDSAYDGKTAVTALQSLMTRQNIDLYYTWGVSPNEAVLPVTHARKLPVIAETSLKSSVVGRPLSIRAAPTGEMTAKVIAAHLATRGYRSIGILLVDIPYYRDIVESLQRNLEPSGVSVEVMDTFSPEASDFKSTITKLRSRGYDSIGVFLLNDQVVTYYRQAHTLQFDVQSFGAAIHDSQQLITRAGKGAEGALFVGYDVVPDFQSRWLREFHDDSRVGSGANAYDTALMIADLFGDGRSAGLSSEETIARFSTISDRRGVSGDFRFAETADAGKHFDFPLSARIVRMGRVERLH